MNLTFLFFIALPLGVYLIILVFQTRDLGDGDGLEREHAAADAPVLTTPDLDTLAQSAAELVVEPAAVVPFSPESVEPEPPRTPTRAPLAAQAVALTNIIPDSSPEIPTLAQAIPPQPALSDPPAPGTELAEKTAPVVESGVPEPAAASLAEPEIAAQPTPTLETTLAPAANVSLPTPPRQTDGAETPDETPDELDPILPEGPVTLGDKGSPKYAFDYRGRLWVEKKRKGFFRQLRRPHLPPEDPNG